MGETSAEAATVSCGGREGGRHTVTLTLQFQHTQLCNNADVVSMLSLYYTDRPDRAPLSDLQ